MLNRDANYTQADVNEIRRKDGVINVLIIMGSCFVLLLQGIYHEKQKYDAGYSEGHREGYIEGYSAARAECAAVTPIDVHHVERE